MRPLVLAVLFIAACGTSSPSDSCPDRCIGATMIDCDVTPSAPACNPQEPPPDDSGGGISAPIAPVTFNGGFEARDFPYTGSCSCSGSTISCSPAMTNNACYCADHDSNPATPMVVQCSAPTDLPYGWSVTPSDTFRGSRGNGGVFFLYGMGHNPGSPRPPGYVVPDGSALYFQTCDNSDRWNNQLGPMAPNSPPDGIPDSDWCYQTDTITARSQSFTPTPGATYQLSAWFYSTTFMSVGTVHENRLQLRARFFNSSGVEVGGGTAQAPNGCPTPVDSSNRSIWQFFSGAVTVPSSATSGVVEVVIGRNHQSNVYVDDVALSP